MDVSPLMRYDAICRPFFVSVAYTMSVVVIVPMFALYLYLFMMQIYRHIWAIKRHNFVKILKKGSADFPGGCGRCQEYSVVFAK